jgi:WD40 repeat protein
MEKENTTETTSKLDFPNKPLDFYYPENYKEKFTKDADMPSQFIKFNSIIGQDCFKRYNLNFLNDQEIILAIANTFQIINIDTKDRRIFHGTENTGVGAVTVHPEKKYFAVGECGEFPNIYIYEYPSMKIYRILRKGTEKAYSAVSFNTKGDLLGSVGSDPDYNLVIWNWVNETIVLKAKAFSQEIFNCFFSSNIEGKLITTGVGHIKFWEMAKTFTGLKLQGELGKFGQVELSDISAFVEYPDGKVLSGTEYGTFLLWEGIFIKAHVKLDDNIPLHNGQIEYMSWEANEYILSGGHDGYLKWWSLSVLDNLAIDDNNMAFAKPVKEILLLNPTTNQPIKIINLVKQANFWLIQDGNGYLIRVYPLEEGYKYETIYDFHSGPIVKTQMLVNTPYLVSQGSDSKTFIHNLLNNEKIVLEKEFLLNCSACDVCPRDHDENIVIAMGYNNGLFRTFQLNSEKLTIEPVFQTKAHEEAILKVKFSHDKTNLITVTQNEVFLFIIAELNNFKPLWFIRKEEKIVDVDWHPDSSHILIGLSNGNVEEIEIPLVFDNSNTFLLKDYKSKVFTVRLADSQLDKDDERKRKKKDIKKKEEPGPAPILNCRYVHLYQTGDFMVTAQKPYNEFLYLCNFNNNNSPKLRPINFWRLPNQDNYIKYISKNFIILANNKGSIQVRNKKLLDHYIEIFPNAVGVKSVTISSNQSILVVSYKDGTMITYKLLGEQFEKYLDLMIQPDSESKEKSVKEIIDAIALVDNKFDFQPSYLTNYLKAIKPANDFKPIANREEEMIALEKGRKYNEEIIKKKKAEEVKNKNRSKIERLRQEYQSIKEQNNELFEEGRLKTHELIVDEQYFNYLKNKREENLNDIKHKYDYLKAKENVSISKINTFFINSVKTPKFYVFGLESNNFVCSIRCPNLPQGFNESIEDMEDKLDALSKRLDFDSLEDSYSMYLLNSDARNENREVQIQTLLEKINQKLTEYEVGESNHETASKFNKDWIKSELTLIDSDVKELNKIMSEKVDVKKLVYDYKTQANLSHANSERDIKSVSKSRCPEAYSLRANLDRYLNEKSMKIVLNFKKVIFDYLLYIHEDRERFNDKVRELRDKKVQVINELKESKKELEKINETLGVNEKLDWLEYECKEDLEFPENDLKIGQSDLEIYIYEKAKKEKDMKLDMFVQNMPERAETSESVTKFFYAERKRKINETSLDVEYKNLQALKLERRKQKIITECKKKIKDFDEELYQLKKEKIDTHMKQKLGELELIIKMEEYGIIRAHDSDDQTSLKKLEEIYHNYEDNLSSIKNTQKEISNIENSLNTYRELRERHIKDFEQCIAQEKESKAKLEQLFYQKAKRLEIKDGIQTANTNANDDKFDDDDLDNEKPRAVSSQVWMQVVGFRAEKLREEKNIEIEEKKLNEHKIIFNNLKKAKYELDKKLSDLRDKINTDERKKIRYLNLVEIAVPLKLDKISKLEVQGEIKKPYNKLSSDISKGVLFTKDKLYNLHKLYKDMISENKMLAKGISTFDEKFKIMENSIKLIEKQKIEILNKFNNEQILKFGFIINFDALLDATKSTLADKLENEYRTLKKEADRQIDEYNIKIDGAKADLALETKKNTEKLEIIKNLLKNNQAKDKELEGKNSELSVYSNLIFRLEIKGNMRCITLKKRKRN